jgi:hypothetical protein
MLGDRAIKQGFYVAMGEDYMGAVVADFALWLQE